MGIHTWLWLLDGVEGNQADGLCPEKIWILEAEFAVHLDDMARDFSLLDIFDNLLAAFE